jgi:hypothetical protein
MTDVNLPTEKLESELEKQVLAQMAGYVPEEATKTSEDDIEPCQVTTKGTFWDRAGIKTSAVAGSCILLVATFGVTVTTLISFGDNQEAVPQKVSKEIKPLEKEESIEELKTNSALATLTAQMEKYNSQSKTESKPKASSTPVSTQPQVSRVTPTVAPTPRVTPTVASNSTPTKTTVATRAISVPPVATATTKGVSESKYEPVRTKSVEKVTAPLPKATEPLQLPPKQSKEQIQRVETVPKPEFKVPNNQISNSTIDPNEAWQAAANSGVYVASSDSDTGELSESGEYKSVATSADSKSKTVSNNGLIVGTKTFGYLESQIVWTGNGDFQDQQSHLIRLTEPLKNLDGTVAIPANTLLITHVKSIEMEGWLDLAVKSVVVNSSTGVIEKPVAEGAILILAENGSPLRAEYKTLSHLHSNNESNDNLTFEFSNDRSFPLKRALQKNRQLNQQRLNIKKSSDSRNRQNDGSNFRVLTLNKGSKVQIYVNRSFSL